MVKRQKVRESKNIRRTKRRMTESYGVYDLINYFDVWGNAEDGWDVNDLSKDEEDIYIDDSLSDEEIVDFLIDQVGFLSPSARGKIEVWDNGDMIEFSVAETGEPLGRLERKRTVEGKSMGESRKSRRARKPMKEGVAFPELDDRAMALYDARDYIGFSQFTDDELAKLVSMCYMTKENPWGRAYDDEVFDEIARRDTYDEIHASGKRYVGITESARSGRIRSRRSMKEAKYELSPQHDARKSFYGKAHVVTDDDGTQILYSYNTPVVEIKGDKVKLLPMWDSSQTTLRHVKEFLKQNGFSAGSKGEIARLYGESVKRGIERRESIRKRPRKR